MDPDSQQSDFQLFSWSMETPPRPANRGAKDKLLTKRVYKKCIDKHNNNKRHYQSIKHLPKEERIYLAVQEVKKGGPRSSRNISSRWGISRSTLFERTSRDSRPPTRDRLDHVAPQANTPEANLSSQSSRDPPSSKRRGFGAVSQEAAERTPCSPSSKGFQRCQLRSEANNQISARQELGLLCPEYTLAGLFGHWL
eukprot:TRINITY_DN1626_c0_g1_i2.p1 TRINITY_DN1626_c0_g1~~TRINITY_DN1626_c0_g1_i2.p1  ORF type:complete len:196 (-),score=26.55 TRINITY_DN1626_c0_g1_i2:16-603(-)